MVNKGPHSSKTVKFVRRLVQGGKAHVVRGNHDEALLEAVHSATFVGKIWRFLWPYGKYHYIKVFKIHATFIVGYFYHFKLPKTGKISPFYPSLTLKVSKISLYDYSFFIQLTIKILVLER